MILYQKARAITTKPVSFNFSVAQSDAWIWRSDFFEFQQAIGPFFFPA